MADLIQDALSQYLASFDLMYPQMKEVTLALLKRKGVKEAFAPLASQIKHFVIRREVIFQRMLELPTTEPLHQAAVALLEQGGIAWKPWAALPVPPQPKRETGSLVVSKVTPVVYACELAARVSVWSLQTGLHEADLAIPGGKDNRVSSLVELPDGTLRAVLLSGQLAERTDGAKAFKEVLPLAPLRNGWAASADLARILCQLALDPVTTAIGDELPFALFDAKTQQRQEFRLPLSGTQGGFVRSGDYVVIAGYRYVATESDEVSTQQYSIVVVNLQTGEVRQAPFGSTDVDLMGAGHSDGLVRIRSVRAVADTRVLELQDLNVETLLLTPAPPEPEVSTAHRLSMSEGHSYDPHDGVIRDAEGSQLSTVKLAGAYRTFAAWDSARGQLVIAGNDPAVAVTVYAPFDAARVKDSPAPVQTKLLPWTQPGTVLTYEIADFDAQDTWHFEVLPADVGLALKILMDEEVVAECARFSEKALADATTFIELAQGGANGDLTKEQHKCVPPLVLSRAGYRKLAAGRKLTHASAWSEKTTLTAGSTTTGHVLVNGADQAVSILTATSEDGVVLTVLADAEWPLVIERNESDCFVRLLSIDTSRATDASPRAATLAESSLVSANKQAEEPQSAAAAGENSTRRFQLVEGSTAKFWEVEGAGSLLTVRYGKLGTTGQTQTKDLGSVEAVSKQMEQLIKEKSKKGYVPV